MTRASIAISAYRNWLAERGIEIDRCFDFRYSVLPFVFAGLLRNYRISEMERKRLVSTVWTQSMSM